MCDLKVLTDLFKTNILLLTVSYEFIITGGRSSGHRCQDLIQAC